MRLGEYYRGMESRFRRIARSALLLWFFISCPLVAQVALGQEAACVAESNAVFVRAFSSHRAMVREVVKGSESGKWHPDGSFRLSFFEHNARLLRQIRSLLKDEASVERDLLRVFRGLLATRLPRPLMLSASVRRSETRLFKEALGTYLRCRGIRSS